jgi:hypothetical protein
VVLALEHCILAVAWALVFSVEHKLLVQELLVSVEAVQQGLFSYIQPSLWALGMFVLEHTWVQVLVLVWVCAQHELVVCYRIGISILVVHDVVEVHTLLMVVFHHHLLLYPLLLGSLKVSQRVGVESV